MSTLELSIKAYFGNISNESMDCITACFKEEVVLKDKYFLKKGRQTERLSFIQSGCFRIFVETDDKEVTQWISTPGSFVTDLSGYLFNQPSRWNIQALSESKIFSLYKTDYPKLEQSVPEWLKLERLFVGKCFTMLEDRIFNHLSMSAEERYQAFFESNADLFNEIPLQYIASMLGMAPETLSRIRKKNG